MKKIGLFCTGGLTTTLLVNKMNMIANERGYDFDITCYPTSALKEKGRVCDLIILGPQAASSLDEVKVLFPQKKIMVCDPGVFSQLDGKKILEAAMDFLEN